jgi:hypothetical protein
MIDKPTSTSEGARGRARGIPAARSRGASLEKAADAGRNERVLLITFMWSGRTGSQPVIYADRSWVQ